MISQVLMKPGAFNVNLIPDAPFSAYSAVAGFDHIVITPVRLEPITAFTDANILASSIYTGVVLNKATGTSISISGQDLSIWMGTSDGVGSILGGSTTVNGVVYDDPQTLTTWVTDLCPAELVVGTVTNITVLAGSFMYMTRREALDAVCGAMQGEWRVNPNGTLDAGTAANLFVTAPTVVITRKDEGQDGAYRGLESTGLRAGMSVDGFTTAVGVAGPGIGGAMTVYFATPTVTTFKGFRNGTLVMERLVDSPSGATPDGTVADNLTAEYNTVRREVTLNSNTYAASGAAKPGDYVHVYDQQAELTDAANQITFRGETITPIKLRVFVLTWPLQQGMGVYARRSAATPVYTDLTDFVAWDQDGVTWEVGAMKPYADPNRW